MTREPYRPTVPDFTTPKEETPLDCNGHPNLARTYIAPNPTQEPEAKPAPEPQEIKEAPFCNAESTRNKHGKAVLRLRFESFEALEAYFADELIGSDMMEGSASKVIGTTLLIWDRN